METVAHNDRAFTVDSLSDAMLLTAYAKDASELAFATLLRRHGPLVFGVCRRILRNASDADDAFQATFLVLAMRARKDKPRSVGAWLHQVATRTSLAMKARTHRRSAIEGMLMRFGSIKPISQPADVESRLVIDEQIGQLAEKYRNVVVLCFLAGMSKAEAAAELGWAEGTVSSRLNHARMLLRRRLQKLGFGPDAADAAKTLGATTVPASLMTSTLEATRAIVGGKIVAGADSTQVLSIAKAVAKPMAVTKMNLAAGAVLLTAVAIALPAASLHYSLRRSGPTNTPASANTAGASVGAVAPQPAGFGRGNSEAPSNDQPATAHGQGVLTAGRNTAERDQASRFRTPSNVAVYQGDIDGNVIQIDGTIAERAVVFISPTADNTTGRESCAITDARGNFQISGCSGDYFLRAFSQDRAVTRSALRVTSGDHVKVQLAPNAAPTITGRVLDSDGNPIQVKPRTGGFGLARAEGAEPHQSGVRINLLVELTPGSGNFRVMHWTREPEMADDEGNFAITGFFPDTRFKVLVQADGYQDQNSAILELVTPGEPIEVPEIVLKK